MKFTYLVFLMELKSCIVSPYCINVNSVARAEVSLFGRVIRSQLVKMNHLHLRIVISYGLRRPPLEVSGQAVGQWFYALRASP